MLCLAISLVALILLLWNRVFVADPLVGSGPRAAELLDRIDPNTADVGLLSALPALGERRALDIIEFREAHRQSDPQGRVFRRPEDLMQVKGIGVAIVDQVRPFLRLDASATSRTADEP